ncbi:hypothetical protein DFP93_11637 [Aneurinibacillus soli]|uniref:Uncharacterized protein n=1 Tax=Aneurinibacillus soli TaxID=1500254 RepID=A0A0U5B032_9BACL|nr:hypothetical protein [Aneurinibacillus soli]PYE59670.1 hypothetical protein DFP93_11637 [Aneurinibacillus soli]BAU29329.1 hypothetical protein CB4_03516 [Aneurinibacillus soli]
MRKKWKIMCWLLLLLAMFGAILFFITRTDAYRLSYDVTGNPLPDYHFNLSGWVEHVTPVITSKTYKNAVYTYHDYRQNSRLFRLTTIKLANGDVLYFARHYQAADAGTVTLSVVAHESAIESIHTFVPGKPASWLVGHSLPASIQSTVYVDGPRLSYRIGSAEVYRPLTHTVIEEQPGRETTVETRSSANQTYHISLPADAQTFATTWGTFSSGRLLNWEDEDALETSLEIEFANQQKLHMDGSYSIIPNNYEPASPTSYYRNPANGEGLRAVKYADDRRKGTLFMDIATHLAYCAAASQNADGFWPTYPRSQWLYHEYGIDYMYMDNRRNADNTTFLLRYQQMFHDPVIAQSLRRFDAYIIPYVDRYKRQIAGRTISFIPDYIGSTTIKASHTSLNHLTANMNYLLEAYLADGDNVKKEAAFTLLSALDVTKVRWIRPDSNFYYALTPALTPYFSGEDYYKLTRDDLLESQALLTRITGKPSNTITYLITQKEKWMEAHPVETN